MSISNTMHVSAGGSRGLTGTGANEDAQLELVKGGLISHLYPTLSSKKINVYVMFRMLCKIIAS